MPKREIEDGECSDTEQTEAKIPKIEEFDNFLFDVNPVEVFKDEEGEIEEKEENSLSSKWASSMRKSLLGEEVVNNKKEPSRRIQRCFNCSGDHIIKDCPEPKDLKRIKKASLEYNSRQQSNSARYHDNDKNSKYKPGRLSSDLRAALSIGPDDIPEWIYRMRRMGFYNGYPPGYLKRALKTDKSAVLLKFHMTSENVVSNTDNNSIIPPPIVDTRKIIYYMGFNNTYGALRDVETFRVPPFELFCEMLQKELNFAHEKEQKIIETEEKQNPKSVDVECEFVTDNKVKNEEEVENPEVVKDAGSGDADDSLTGESISQHIGTPIICRRNINGGISRETLPDLEKFSVGIVPFEAKEENVGERGIFKRIMGKIKDFTTSSST